MKIFRFMSKEEFEKYQSGQELKNDKIHPGKTNSKGFCFLNLEEYKPEQALHFLSGIVSFDICAIFETNIKLNKTYGIYAKPVKPSGDIMQDLLNLYSNFDNSFRANEYCTTEYNNKVFNLIKYSKEIWKQWVPWVPYEVQNELLWSKNK